MKELVVISGKGGTGKTSIVASFAAMADEAVLADCDVDAADLHLVLEPQIIRREEFYGGRRAEINPAKCTGCGRCAELCRFDAVSAGRPEISHPIHTGYFSIDPISCEGCGVCAWFCPAEAIDFSPAINGEWYVSQTRFGPMVHAKLGIGEENSGKLVSTVRREAHSIADERGMKLVIIDGSPGIGCPVVASITAADTVLIVTEPTLSGQHDMARVAELTRHFGIKTLLCVNKWNINPKITDEIESHARNNSLTVVGRIRYDKSVTAAQLCRKAVVEYTPAGCSEDIKNLWAVVAESMKM
ncbi:MAG TPA: ATP-binding protein [Phycisphaerae bacterium]|nr:ATP-binding protein [Phycisphaerae bacterium]